MPRLTKKSADKFIKLMVESSPLLKLISFTPMNDPISSYPLLTLSRYKTRPATAKEVVDMKKVNEIMINFNAKELVLPLIIPDGYIEDMESAHEKVATYVAEVFGMDLQYLFINGDTAATGQGESVELRKAMDGIVKQIATSGRTLKMGANDTVLAKLQALIKKLSSEKTVIADPNLKILVGSEAYTSLWDSIATNSDSKALLMNNGAIKYRGKDVIEIPELEKIIVINPGHIAAGFCRDIFIETQRYPEARGNKVVCSARVDFQVVTEAALMEA
jgi:hypothetical protein